MAINKSQEILTTTTHFSELNESSYKEQAPVFNLLNILIEYIFP